MLAQRLAFFSKLPAFAKPCSTSNLVKPEFSRFLAYSRQFYEKTSGNENSLVHLLEQRLAEFHHAKYCITVASGFWGLVLAMKCLALPQKKEVIIPSLTYRRMADAIYWAGLIPYFCDVDEKTLSLNLESVKLCLNEETALILAVHPIINCCDVMGLTDLAKKYKLPLLLDSVESVFETFQGKKIGAFGDAECFSLHASKLINGFEGGYITTSCDELAQQLTLLRNGEGTSGLYAPLNPLHAAMALANLDELEIQITHNRHIYQTYRQALTNIPELRLLTFDEHEKCSYKNIVIELKETWPLTREQTLAVLHCENILARAYYSPALHQKSYAYPVRAAPICYTNQLAERFMLLPCGFFINEHDVRIIIDLLKIIRDSAADIKKNMPDASKQK